MITNNVEKSVHPVNDTQFLANSISSSFSRQSPDEDHSSFQALNSYDVGSVLPFTVKVMGVSVFDLSSLHLLGANSPAVFFSCGHRKYVTSVANQGGSHAEWESLDMPFAITQESDVLHILAKSGSTVAGSMIVTVKDLVFTPRDVSGNTVVTGVLLNDGEVKGRIQIIFDLDIGKRLDSLFNPSSSSYFQGKHDLPPAIKDSSLSAPYSFISSQPPNLDEEISPSHSLFPRSPNLKSQSLMSSIGLNTSQSVSLTPFFDLTSAIPFSARIVSVSVFDLPSLHVVGLNSPVVYFSSEHRKYSTSIAQHSGNHAEWEDLKISIPVENENVVIQVLVRSGSTVAGATSVSVRDLVCTPRDANGNTVIAGVLMNDGSIKGRIQIEFDLGIGERLDSLFDPNLSNASELFSPSKSIQSSNIAEMGLSPTRSIQSVRSGKSGSSNHAPELNSILPFTMRIIDLSVVDLPSLHNVGLNSPCVHLSCNTVEFQTSPSKNTGSHAEWTDLNFSLEIFEETDVLKIVAKSGSVIAGALGVPVRDVILTPVDNNGFTFISGFLRSDGLFRGRIQIKLFLGIQDKIQALREMSAITVFPVNTTEIDITSDAPVLNSIISNADEAKFPSSVAYIVHDPVRLYIVDMSATDMKNFHNARRSAPSLKIECGSFKAQVKVRCCLVSFNANIVSFLLTITGQNFFV